jgi:hypothetical protein
LNTSKCPEVGSLVRLHHYMDANERLYIGSLNEGQDDLEVDSGTLALVIGIRRHGTQSEQAAVPIVLIGDIVGWVFCDEWEPVEP